MKKETDLNVTNPEVLSTSLSRRNFLAFAGIGVLGTTLVSLSSCKREAGIMPDGTIDLGGGDIGILNYAYALEQLEAAFYTKVAASFYAGASAQEISRLTEIRNHEIAHREFFKNALGSSAIPDLEVDFSSIDFNSRNSVLGTAKAFEDLGVSAYNGAGKLIANADYLLLAGKIVSVEARHAAYIRDIISNGSFADMEVVDANGLEMSREPNAVLTIASTYLKSKLSAQNLPTS
ncbi:MAG: ferritin-like domain-containing protein [Sphingobacteriales bacterium]|nr:MAG: ferritin-like domain-containing protein [Sphingobacteriales bacterium]